MIIQISFRSVQYDTIYLPNGHLISNRQVILTHNWCANGHVHVISLRSSCLLTAHDPTHARSILAMTALTINLTSDVTLTHVRSIFAMTALAIVLASIVAIILDQYIFLYPPHMDIISDGYFPLYPSHKDFIPNGYFPLYP